MIIKNSNTNLYLYHATDKANLNSILERGLLIHSGKSNWDKMYCDGMIFLAVDASVAEDYVDAQENAPEETVVLKVKYDLLDETEFGYDWNNRCKYMEDINSCVYKKDIPAKYLSVCEVSSEPSQSIEDFEGTYLYEVLLDTFEYEVETNEEE